MSEIRTISIKNFKTHSGAIYPKINLYYQQFGRQIGKAPIVLVKYEHKRQKKKRKTPKTKNKDSKINKTYKKYFFFTLLVN
jgi:hypothetical protein